MHVNYSDVPLEIQIEIMKRIPIKSLIRFRSVSKSWKSIIESSEFITDYNIHTHLYNHQQLLVSLYNSIHAYTSDDDDDDDSFPDQHHFRLIPSLSIHRLVNDRMIGFSQGLFAVYRVDEYFRQVVVIWNPSIRKSVDIPLSDTFTCTNYDSFIGFGVCNATDPMLVKISSPALNASRKIRLQVELFKLSTGKWRLLSTTCCPRKSLGFRQKVVATERFIYWLANDRKIPCFSAIKNLILSFDMISEKFTEISLPPSLARNHPDDLDISKLSRESFAVLETHGNSYNVWMVTMEHGGQYLFQKLLTINNRPNESIKNRVVGFRKNGKPIIHKPNPFLHNEQTLFVYEPGSNWFNPIGINHYPCFAGSYMGTLLLLDH